NGIPMTMDCIRQNEEHAFATNPALQEIRRTYPHRAGVGNVETYFVARQLERLGLALSPSIKWFKCRLASVRLEVRNLSPPCDERAPWIKTETLISAAI